MNPAPSTPAASANAPVASTPGPSAQSRLVIVDTLRGLAAMSVCWFHFTTGNSKMPEGWLKDSGTYGWLGVNVFFVISGFIIPYALHRAGYRLSDYGRFVVKRLVRLDPPYIASILFVLALGYAVTLAPGYKGEPFKPSLPQVLAHLGYLNTVIGYEWLNVVYWTLAIEFQYYLTIGLVYFAIASPKIAVRGAAFVFMGVLAYLMPWEPFLPHWLFLFMFGIAAFQLRTGIIGPGQFFAWIALLTAGAWITNDGVVTCAGLVTALLIAFAQMPEVRPLIFLGNISYSVYLMHVPIGLKVFNLAERFTTSFPGKVATLVLALALTIVASWVLYRVVELPAQRWSSKIRYKRPASTSPAAQARAT